MLDFAYRCVTENHAADDEWRLRGPGGVERYWDGNFAQWVRGSDVGVCCVVMPYAA